MNTNYYDTIGAYLNQNLDSEEDPLAENRTRTKYRRTMNRMERRPPPKIPEEEKRVPVPQDLVEDFAILNLLPGEPFHLCKKSWKRLLKKYHPDIQSQNFSEKESTLIINRINKSYYKIKHWYETGKILTEGDTH